MITVQILPLCPHGSIPADCAECRRHDAERAGTGIFLTTDAQTNGLRLADMLRRRRTQDAGKVEP